MRSAAWHGSYETGEEITFGWARICARRVLREALWWESHERLKPRVCVKFESGSRSMQKNRANLRT